MRQLRRVECWIRGDHYWGSERLDLVNGSTIIMFTNTCLRCEYVAPPWETG